MIDETARLVDDVGTLDVRIRAAKVALAELQEERTALVETLEGIIAGRPRITIDGRRWRASVVTRTVVQFPTKSADPGRAEALKHDMRSAGLWDLVSDVSYPRLKSLWFHPAQATDAFRRLAGRYACESTKITVRCAPVPPGANPVAHDAP